MQTTGQVECKRVVKWSAISHQGMQPLVVIDNAHEIPAADLQAVFGCTPHMRFILLCQPLGSI
ncbi:hypothetical protein, partial [Pseudomonas sp. RTB2]